FSEPVRNLQAPDSLGEGTGGLPSAGGASGLALDSYVAARLLIRRAVAELGRHELERIHQAQRRGRLPGKDVPGSAAHKAARWAEYRANRGQWPFERWSTTYDQNVVRSSRAHAVADAHQRKIGWGEREVRVTFEDVTRVLDIGDRDEKRGVEVKSGYVTYTADVAS